MNLMIKLHLINNKHVAIMAQLMDFNNHERYGFEFQLVTRNLRPKP